MSWQENAKKVCRILGSPSLVAKIFLWRPFSLASHDLVLGLIERGIRPRLLIDVGSNEGQFARASRQMFGLDLFIAGFEPLSIAFDRLRANFRSDGRARFLNVAIGDRAGSADINVNAYSQSSSLMSLSERHLSAFPGARVVGVEKVEVLRLDEAVAGVEWEHPALLKIDVQGYELKVLDGAEATLSRVDYVLVETGVVQMYVDEPAFDAVDVRLQAAGFEFVAPLATLRQAGTETALQVDALYRRKR